MKINAPVDHRGQRKIVGENRCGQGTVATCPPARGKMPRKPLVREVHKGENATRAARQAPHRGLAPPPAIPQAARKGRLNFLYPFGIPNLGLQLMIIVVKPVDFSGNGADSAAVAGYLHVPALVLAAVCVVGFVYYMVSGRWVLQVMRAADPSMPQAAVARVPAWRLAPGWVMIAAGIVSIVRFADWAIRSSISGPFIGEAMLAWTIACAILTRWKAPVARAVLARWLAPGVIGMLALFPLGFIVGAMISSKSGWSFCRPYSPLQRLPAA